MQVFLSVIEFIIGYHSSLLKWLLLLLWLFSNIVLINLIIIHLYSLHILFTLCWLSAWIILISSSCIHTLQLTTFLRGKSKLFRIISLLRWSISILSPQLIGTVKWFMGWLLLIGRLILWLFCCRTIRSTWRPSYITSYNLTSCVLLICNIFKNTSNLKVFWALVLFHYILKSRLLNESSKLVETFATAFCLINMEGNIQITHIQRFLTWWVLFLKILLCSQYSCNSLERLAKLAHFGVQ